MLEYERKYWSKNKQHIAGIDEAGRGPLAGPVVAAAVIFPHDINLPEVNEESSDDKIAIVIMNFFIDIFYSIFFIILAYLAFWIIVVLTILSFIVRAVGSDQPEDLKNFTKRLSIYISDCLVFSSQGEKDKPFPFGKFPS